MFKENIMKKIAGLSLAAVVMMPGVVSAAAKDAQETTDYSVTSKVCTAKSANGLAWCAEQNNETVESISTTSTAIDVKGLVISLNGKNLTLGGKLTINAGSTLNITNADVDGTSELEILGNGKVVVNNGTVDITTLTVKGTEVTGGYKGASFTATSATASKTTVKAAVNVTEAMLNVTNTKGVAVEGDVTADSNSTINVSATNGKTAVSVSGTVPTVNAIKGDVTASKSVVNVSNGNVEGDISLTSSTLNASGSKVTGDLTITGDTGSKAFAKEITGTATTASAKDYVEFVSSTVPTTAPKGVVKYVAKDNADKTYVAVYSKNAEKVVVNAEETLVVLDVNDIKDSELAIATGAKVENKTAGKIDVTVGDKVYTIEKDKTASIVAGNVEEQPVNPEKPGTDGNGNVLPPKNPGTGDNVVSYVTVALTSIASLGLAVKKFLF